MSTTSYFAASALLPHGWEKHVLISVNQNGWITDVKINQNPSHGVDLKGPVLPGMPNLHSHAFQRAMAGLAERVTAEKDSFWTWREIMYQFLRKLTPEDMEAIAAQLYVEMLKAGFTAVGEFHYVHHQPDGSPYLDRALTSKHIISAALETGIAITHLPVLYAYSGFGAKAPIEGQKRFINNEIEIMDIIANLVSSYKNDPQITIGLAHHSLRAVTPGMLKEATLQMQKLNPVAPIHIHIAEQIKEVNECKIWSGKSPVEWLLENMNIDHRWCLVHATHMTELETQNLAHSGSVVGLCPTTEANLGDGIFNLAQFIQAGGKFGIGSDSHISVNLIEELRTLEYGQRLLHQERAVAREQDQSSIGASLYGMSLAGGSQALGRAMGQIAIGKRADFIALDPKAAALVCKEDNLILDAMIFASNSNPVRHVVAGGKHIVKDFHHKNEEKIFNDYQKVLSKLFECEMLPSLINEVE